MAAVSYSCPFDIAVGEPPLSKKCNFSSSDSRILINHCLEWHNEIVGVCHEEGCEGKVYKHPGLHWEGYHAAQTNCVFCDEQSQTYDALSFHMTTYHQQGMGYVNGQVPSPSDRMSLLDTLKLFVSAPQLQFIQLRPNVGVFYDAILNRPVMGVELLNPEILKDRVARPRPLSFKHNLELPETQITTAAVHHAGYDAAHIIPADDWTADFDDFNATFDNVNLTAMQSFLNRGAWNSGLEHHVRKVVENSVTTLVLTFCHYSPSQAPQQSLSKLVYIPESFSKVVYTNKGIGSWLGQCFNLKNEENRTGRACFWQYKCSFAELQTVGLHGVRLTPVLLTWDEQVKVYRCKRGRCNKSFYNYQDLKAHKEIHSDEFTCRRCRHRSDNKKQLDAHMKLRYLRCRFCDKPFPRPHALDRHERLHKGERPYKCAVDECEAAFTCRGVLNDHILAIHGPKQYFCPDPECNKAFARASTLKHHRFIHFPIMRYKCSECEYSSRERGNVKRHQTRWHQGVGTVLELDEWKKLAKRLQDEEEEAKAMAE